MLKFATQKKFQRQKISSGSGISGLKKIFSIFRFVSLKFIWIFFISLALVYGIVLAFKYTLFSPEYRIQKVNYSVSSVKQYDNPYLYKKISTALKGENYYIISSSLHFLLDDVRAEYPFVNDIILTYKGKSTVSVKILFDSPQFLIKNQGNTFGVYHDAVFELITGNTLGSGTMSIWLPDYSSGLQSLTGLFFSLSADKLLEQVELIRDGISGIQKIVYLAGGGRTILFLSNGKKVYINNMIDVSQQIKNFALLKKFYTDFDVLREVDLGSLEIDKVIVKK